MASSKPSFPAPSEPNLRRLGVRSAGSERPLRAQLVVVAVGLLLVVAVPLYFLRRPSESHDSGGQGEAAAQAQHRLIRSAMDAGQTTPEIHLGSVQRVKCSASPTRQGNEGNLCDRLPILEQELAKAIRGNTDCAPQTGKEGTINFVLTANFSKKRLHVFPGASGTWKGPQAKAAAKCVRRSLPDVSWDKIPHRYRYYMIAIMAKYPAPDPLNMLPQFE